MNNHKHALIIGGLVVVLLLGGLFWNYTETIKEKNAIERERIEANERMKEAELQQERDLQEAKIQAEKNKELDKQLSYNICIASAEDRYDANWDADCKLEYEKNEKEYEKCFNVNKATYGDAQTVKVCRGFYPALKKTDCTLPKFRADENNRLLKEEKDRCAKAQ